MTATATALVALSAFLAGGLVGMLYEHLRPGGTADLTDRLRTVTRLRRIDDRRAS